MSHNVENMFSVKQTPWHGLGSVIQDAPTIEDGIKLAGLDWNVNVHSAFIEVPHKYVDEATKVETEKLEDVNLDDFAKVFVRSDNKKVLGIVGPKTYPLQNVKAFEFFQPFLDAKEAALETAGSLCEGQRIWVMAKIQRENSVIVKDDEIAKFVLLSNSHDGTTAVRVGFTPIRVVCANTLAMAHGDKASKLIRVRHSKAIEKNLEDIRETMNLANEEFEATAEQFRFLASKQINAADLKRYVKIVFKMDAADSEMNTKSRNILDAVLEKHEDRTSMVKEMMAMLTESKVKSGAKLLDTIIENFESGKGTEIKSTRGTLWTAYNAVNEYLNYDRGHGKDTRLNSLWFGESNRTNTLALDTALEFANAA